jgi:superfamily II RNA helicase
MQTYLGFRLDPFQEKAIRAIDAGHNVLVAAPTGAGKTLIADYLVDSALEAGRGVIYTAPVKALSNQKFRDFSHRHPGRVGIVTGDVSIHPRAPILIMTTEVLRNTVFVSPRRLESVGHVILDEIHYIDDPERGTVWEETLLFAPPALRFLCLSATAPNLEQLSEWIRTVREAPVETVREERRPVPLLHRVYAEGVGLCDPRDLRSMHRRPPRGRRRRPRDRGAALLEHVLREEQLPCLYFSFGRRRCEDLAAAAARADLLPAGEKERCGALFDRLVARFGLEGDPAAEAMRHLAARGVGFHHAGMLPALKEVIERLFTSGLLRLIFTTETFALGINMPARTVIFDELRKFRGGGAFGPLMTREYFQMAGRAGRRGIDTEGFVYARIDPAMDSPPVAWRIITGKPEPIESRFNLCYSTILNIYAHAGTRIHEAQERSFYCFQRPKPLRRFLRRQLQAKLRVLTDLHYIDRAGLTPKGRFAARMYGFELPAAEMVFHRYMERFDDAVLAAVAASIPFEARRRVHYAKASSGPLPKAAHSMAALVGVVRSLEKKHGVKQLTPLPDFSIALTAYRWARGARFEDLAGHTDEDPGDLVRALRMTVQILRQIRFALPRGDPGRARLRRALNAVNRGIVNAEDELHVSLHEEEPPAPGASGSDQ